MSTSRLFRTAIHTLLVALIGQTWAAADRAAAADSKARPNIVLIISDDHCWTDYSFLGHPHVRTPNIDRLAGESLTFTRGYVPSSLCCPSLASIITGLYPHQHLITGNDPPMPPGMVGREYYDTPEYHAGREVMNKQLEAVPTLPRLLSQANFNSLQTGKWWQGDYRRGGFTHGMTRGERYGDAGIQIGRRTMKPIYDFIAESRREGRPFFVWYAPMMPHQAHNPPPKFLNNYVDVAPSLPVAKYWGMVEWFDDTVGRLLNHLDKQGLAENTIVIYVTDNGYITDPKTGEPTNKSKMSPYDGGLRTPIMVRWPGHVAPERSEALVMSLDIVPTLLAAAGVEPPPGLPGINLLDPQAVAGRGAIFGECFTHESREHDNPAASICWRWAIDGDWKLIVPDAHNRPKRVVELYNLADDPHEEHNLAAEQAPRVETMRSKVDAWWPAQR